MGAMTAAEAFAFAPNFQKGIKAAGRILILLKGTSKIVDPDRPLADFVSIIISKQQNFSVRIAKLLEDANSCDVFRFNRYFSHHTHQRVYQYIRSVPSHQCSEVLT